MNITKPKLKLKPRKVPVKRYVKSILEKNYYIYPYIGPLLGIKILLKPFVRDIPSVKEYIKYIHQKQKNTWLSSSKERGNGSCPVDWSENAHKYCELVNLFHSAAREGLIDIVKYILEIDEEMWRCSSGNETIHHFIIDAYDDGGQCVTLNAVSNLDVFKLLSYKQLYACGGFEVPPFIDTNLLIEAIEYDSFDVAKWIIERAIEIFEEEKINDFETIEEYVNQEVERRVGPEWYASVIYKSALYLMLEKFDTQPECPQKKEEYVLSKDIIKLLIQNGAKIPRSKLDNFLYLTRHFEDMDAEHYIKMNHWDRFVQSVLTISGKREYYLKNRL